MIKCNIKRDGHVKVKTSGTAQDLMVETAAMIQEIYQGIAKQNKEAASGYNWPSSERCWIPAAPYGRSLTMADNLKELSELVAALKMAPILPRQFYYPECLVQQAAEQYKDQDWYINGHDGSQYYHGVQTKWPCTNIDLTRLNEKIAATWQPNYLRQLQQIPPEERRVVLLGEWGSRRFYHGSAGCGKSFFPHNYDEEGE